MLLSKAFSKLLATQQMVDADCVSRHPWLHFAKISCRRAPRSSLMRVSECCQKHSTLLMERPEILIPLIVALEHEIENPLGMKIPQKFECPSERSTSRQLRATSMCMRRSLSRFANTAMRARIVAAKTLVRVVRQWGYVYSLWFSISFALFEGAFSPILSAVVMFVVSIESYTRLYTSVWCTFHQRESELVAVGKPALSTPCHLAKVQDMTPWIVGVPATGFS
jgi:predicted membrane protein